MIFQLYNAAMRLASPLLDRVLERRLARGKEDPERIQERRGKATRPRPPGRIFWVHGASVGECQAALTLIENLLARDPALHVLLTSGTRTSAELMAGRLPERAVHQFVPVDQPTWIARFLDHWEPSAAIFVESDLWPNLVLAARDRHIPLILANARMSKSSFTRWRRLKFLTGRLFEDFALILASSEAQKQSFETLTRMPVDYIGNLKRAASPLSVDQVKLTELKKAAGARPVFLAASTHEGEETEILTAHRHATEHIPGLLTVIVPRHPNRGTAIETLTINAGLVVARRSEGGLPDTATEVYIADTMGEMGTFFALADTVFVAGSLVPVGGHNPLEPAHFSKPVLFGPLMPKNADIAAEMIAAGIAEEVVDGIALGDRIVALTDDSPARAAMTGAALTFARGQKRIAEEMAERVMDAVDRHGNRESGNRTGP